MQIQFGGCMSSKMADPSSTSTSAHQKKKKGKHSQPPQLPKREDEFVTLARQTRTGLVQDTRALTQELNKSKRELVRDFSQDVQGMQADISNILRPQQPDRREVDELISQIQDEVELERRYPPAKKK